MQPFAKDAFAWLAVLQDGQLERDIRRRHRSTPAPWKRVAQEQEVERWRQVGSAMEEDRGTRAAAEQGCSRIESDGVTAGQRAAKTPRWVDNVGGFLAIPEVVLTGGTDEFRREFVNKSQPAVFKVKE